MGVAGLVRRIQNLQEVGKEGGKEGGKGVGKERK